MGILNSRSIGVFRLKANVYAYKTKVREEMKLTGSY